MATTSVLQDPKSLSGAKTTFSAAVDAGQINATSVGVIVEVTAISGLATALTLSVQWSNDGASWADADPADVFASIVSAGTRLARTFPMKGRSFRLKEVLAGASSSATYKATYSYNTN